MYTASSSLSCKELHAVDTQILMHDISLCGALICPYKRLLRPAAARMQRLQSRKWHIFNINDIIYDCGHCLAFYIGTVCIVYTCKDTPKVCLCLTFAVQVVVSCTPAREQNCARADDCQLLVAPRDTSHRHAGGRYMFWPISFMLEGIRSLLYGRRCVNTSRP